MSLFPFADPSQHSGSALLEIIKAERQRQLAQLVMIPSESICHPAAAAVLTDATLANVGIRSHAAMG